MIRDELKTGWMMTVLAGTLTLLSACERGALPTDAAAINPIPAEGRAASVASAQHILQQAQASGRLVALPEQLSVKQVPVSPEAMVWREKTRMGEKAIIPSTQPRFDAEAEAQRIQAAHEAVPVSGDIQLSISLAKEDFLLGEPVMLRASLQNVTEQSLRLPPLLDPQFQYSQLLVTTPSGKTIGFGPVAIACSRGDLQVETLQPGEARTQDFPIFFHKDGWIFSEPGVYQIQALYRSTTQDGARADSNRVRLTVQPGTPADQAAAERMMGHEQGLFVMWGEGDHLEAGIQALNDVIRQYPDSDLALYARYALGSNMSVNFMDGRTQQERKANPEEVLRLLEPVVHTLLQDGSQVFSPDRIAGTFQKVAAAYAQLGRVTEARQTLQALLGSYVLTQQLSDAELGEISAQRSTLR